MEAVDCASAHLVAGSQSLPSTLVQQVNECTNSPVIASSEDSLLVVLSENHRNSPLVTWLVSALAHHKLDQAATPHQQAAIFCPTQYLGHNRHCTNA